MKTKIHKRLMAAAIFAMPAMVGAATVNVSPSNFNGGDLPASSPGDTISFAPGTYTLQTNPNGAAATWPAGRTYQGNGATLALSGGVDTTAKEGLVLFNGSDAVTEFTGFTCTDAGMEFQSGVFNVHGNTFQNMQLGIFVAGNTGHVDNNTFTAVGQGIYGYPGDNGTYNQNTINGTTGDDGIHLASVPGNGTVVSGNVITGCKRFGFELQLSGKNITVSNNYVSEIEPPASTGGSWGAYSIACGNANGVTVTGNTGVNDRAGSGCCVEIMGNNATVSNNTSWNYAECILNGAQGASLAASGNTVYGGSLLGADGVPWPIAPLVGSNTVLPLSAMPNPPQPPKSATLISAPATQPTTPTAGPAIPAGITATANGQPGQIAVTCPAGSTLAIYASTLAPSTAASLGTISGTSATIGGIPLDWKVIVTVTSAGTTYTLPAVQVTDSAVPSSGPFNPAVVAAPAASILEFESVDGGKTITRTN
jgi:parallel beta-helix repeat protein